MLTDVIDIDQVRTVDAQETPSQEIFPLRDGCFVHIGAAVCRIDCRYGVVGLYVKDFAAHQANLPAVREKCDRLFFGRELPLKP